MVELGNHGDRIEKEPPFDLFWISDSRQIELRASFEKQIPVAGEATQGIIVKRHAQLSGCACQTGPIIAGWKQGRYGVGPGLDRERRSAAGWVHDGLAGVDCVPGGTPRDALNAAEST
jgi:hypothetical protein